MMTQRNDGGPAFPLEYSQVTSPGMTLRDYFAAKAMQGLVQTLTNSSTTTIVVEAYEFADAMLAEREK